MGSPAALARLGPLFSRRAAGSPGTASLVHGALRVQPWRQRLKLRCRGPFFFFIGFFFCFPFPLICQA